MPIVSDFRVSPPQIHPEFGYFCPAPQTRRLVRVSFVAALVGLALGAVTVAALTRGPEAPVIAASSTVEKAQAETVGLALASADAGEAAGASAAATVSCAEQTWPFLDRPCLRGSSGWQNVRVLPIPTAGRAPVVEPSEIVDANPPELPTPAASTLKREKTAQGRHHRRSRAHRERDHESRRAYAARSSGRYDYESSWYARPRRDAWNGWGW